MRRRTVACFIKLLQNGNLGEKDLRRTLQTRVRTAAVIVKTLVLILGLLLTICSSWTSFQHINTVWLPNVQLERSDDVIIILVSPGSGWVSSESEDFFIWSQGVGRCHLWPRILLYLPDFCMISFPVAAGSVNRNEVGKSPSSGISRNETPLDNTNGQDWWIRTCLHCWFWSEG